MMYNALADAKHSYNFFFKMFSCKLSFKQLYILIQFYRLYKAVKIYIKFGRGKDQARIQKIFPGGVQP